MEHLWSIWAAVAAVVVVVVLVAWWAHVRYWVGRLSVPMEYASVDRVPTADGSAIELRRVPPQGEPRDDLPPILLVHGLGANHRNVDVHPDGSLARFLAARGRDVWLLTLRSGRSDRRFSEHRRVRFAAMVEHDVPLAVETVCDRTGADRVDYVGFSMGGMLLYAALGRTVPEERLRRATIIGSPARIEPPARILRTLRFLPEQLIPGVRLRMPARSFAFLAQRLHLPYANVVINTSNSAPVLARTAMVDLVQDIPARLQADFARWAFRDGEIRVDGERAVEGLVDVDRPALFVAGAGDRLAPPSSVRVAYESWGAHRSGVEKTMIVLGREQGAHADYGHGDLAIGPHLREDLFEPVADFLDRP